MLLRIVKLGTTILHGFDESFPGGGMIEKYMLSDPRKR